MEDDSIMSNFTTGTGQQEGSSNHDTHAGVRKSAEFSEDIQGERG